MTQKHDPRAIINTKLLCSYKPSFVASPTLVFMTKVRVRFNSTQIL